LVNSLLGAIGIGASKPSTPPKAQTTKPGGGVISSILGAFGIGASKKDSKATTTQTTKIVRGGSGSRAGATGVGGASFSLPMAPGFGIKPEEPKPDPWQWIKDTASTAWEAMNLVGDETRKWLSKSPSTATQATSVATATATPTQTPTATSAPTTVPVATVIPTSDYNSVLQEQYGTHVDLTAISNKQQQDEVLRTIFESVNLVGEQTSAAFGNGMSSPQAFEQFFGPKHQITVTNCF
jgi:hypothetical protein